MYPYTNFSTLTRELVSVLANEFVDEQADELASELVSFQICKLATSSLACSLASSLVCSSTSFSASSSASSSTSSSTSSSASSSTISWNGCKLNGLLNSRLALRTNLCLHIEVNLMILLSYWQAYIHIYLTYQPFNILVTSAGWPCRENSVG